MSKTVTGNWPTWIFRDRLGYYRWIWINTGRVIEFGRFIITSSNVLLINTMNIRLETANLLAVWAAVSPTEDSAPWTSVLSSRKVLWTAFRLRSVTMIHPEYREILNFEEMLRYLLIDSAHSRSLPISFHSPLDLTGAHAFTELHCRKCQSDSIR